EDGESVTYTWRHTVEVTWNDLFFAVSPLLLHEATTVQMHSRLANEVRARVVELFDDRNETVQLDDERAGHRISRASDIQVSGTDLETILVQFLALGYITHSTKSRSVKDRGDYWTLT